MAIQNTLTGYELQFFIGLVISLIAGFAIGVERESRGKVAGISTHCLVIAGAFSFTLISIVMEPDNPARIAANIVTGIGFLGAGIILKSEKGAIANVTTAASIWFAASIGMAIGFQWYLMAVAATAYALLVPRIPHLYEKRTDHSHSHQKEDAR